MKSILALVVAFFCLNASAGTATFESGMDGFEVFGATRFTYAQEATKNAQGGDFFLAGTQGTGVLIRRTGGAVFTFEGADFHSRAGLQESSTFTFIINGSLNEFGDTDKKGYVEHVLQPGQVSFIKIAYNQPISSLGLAFKHQNNDWKYFGMDNIQTNAVTAVPEPQTWAMMLAGMLGVTFLNGRRKKTA